MNNYFVLEIKKDLTKLAGNAMGRQIYSSQLQNKIDFNSPITIEFPERVDYIATSFIQGFFHEIVRNIGIMGVENITIKSSISDLKEFIVKNLE